MTARVDLVSSEEGGSEEGEGTSEARAGICEAEPGSVGEREEQQGARVETYDLRRSEDTVARGGDGVSIEIRR